MGYLPTDCLLRADELQLRHGCGFLLAGPGADTRLIQDNLRHRNI